MALIDQFDIYRSVWCTKRVKSSGIAALIIFYRCTYNFLHVPMQRYVLSVQRYFHLSTDEIYQCSTIFIAALLNFTSAVIKYRCTDKKIIAALTISLLLHFICRLRKKDHLV